MDTLAWVYETGGLGLKADAAEAFKWYHRAADLGDADAALHMAIAYDQGEGITVDLAEAVKWYRKAADLGVTSAMNRLAGIYLNGDGGIQKDADEAAKLWRQAADHGTQRGWWDLALPTPTVRACLKTRGRGSNGMRRVRRDTTAWQ